MKKDNAESLLEDYRQAVLRTSATQDADDNTEELYLREKIVRKLTSRGDVLKSQRS